MGRQEIDELRKMRDWNGPNTDLFFSSSSLCLSAIQFNQMWMILQSWCFHLNVQKPSSTLGVFLCPVLVTMCTGGSPGVAGTSGGSQRLPAGWTHTEKPVMLHGTTQSGVCRNVIVFAHNSVRVDLWHRSILSESACLDAPDIRRERPRHQYHQ